MTDTSDSAHSLAAWEAKAAAQADRDAKLFALNKPVVFNALALAGVTRVVVTFDGYGDSGQIESIEAQAGENPIDLPTVEVEISRSVWDSSEVDRRPSSIRDAIEQMAYDLLSQTHGGWENNDGAFGEFIFDVTADTITLEHNERFSDVETFEHEW